MRTVQYSEEDDTYRVFIKIFDPKGGTMFVRLSSDLGPSVNRLEHGVEFSYHKIISGKSDPDTISVIVRPPATPGPRVAPLFSALTRLFFSLTLHHTLASNNESVREIHDAYASFIADESLRSRYLRQRAAIVFPLTTVPVQHSQYGAIHDEGQLRTVLDIPALDMSQLTTPASTGTLLDFNEQMNQIAGSKTLEEKRRTADPSRRVADVDADFGRYLCTLYFRPSSWNLCKDATFMKDLGQRRVCDLPHCIPIQGLVANLRKRWLRHLARYFSFPSPSRPYHQLRSNWLQWLEVQTQGMQEIEVGQRVAVLHASREYVGKRGTIQFKDKYRLWMAFSDEENEEDWSVMVPSQVGVLNDSDHVVSYFNVNRGSKDTGDTSLIEYIVPDPYSRELVETMLAKPGGSSRKRPRDDNPSTPHPLPTAVLPSLRKDVEHDNEEDTHPHAFPSSSAEPAEPAEPDGTTDGHASKSSKSPRTSAVSSFPTALSAAQASEEIDSDSERAYTDVQLSSTRGSGAAIRKLDAHKMMNTIVLDKSIAEELKSTDSKTYIKDLSLSLQYRLICGLFYRSIWTSLVLDERFMSSLGGIRLMDCPEKLPLDGFGEVYKKERAPGLRMKQQALNDLIEYFAVPHTLNLHTKDVTVRHVRHVWTSWCEREKALMSHFSIGCHIVLLRPGKKHNVPPQLGKGCKGVVYEMDPYRLWFEVAGLEGCFVALPSQVGLLDEDGKCKLHYDVSSDHIYTVVVSESSRRQIPQDDNDDGPDGRDDTESTDETIGCTNDMNDTDNTDAATEE